MFLENTQASLKTIDIWRSYVLNIVSLNEDTRGILFEVHELDKSTVLYGIDAITSLNRE